MTVSLRLGVADIPYGGGQDGVTTGDVAEILEERYEVMRTFYDRHESDIAEALTDAMVGAIETVLSGGPRPNNPLAAAETRIEEMFAKFLSDREIEQPARFVGRYSIPTMAAILGASSRFKSKKARGRRPSFIDTGLYQNAFRAWVEDRG